MAVTVAVIAEEGPRERINEHLTAQGISFRGFDDAEQLERGDAQPASILLWIDEETPSISGLIERLTQRYESTRVIVISPDLQRWEVRAALAAGAVGVVAYESLDSALGPCMQATGVGQVCVPKANWRQVEPPPLSTREKQILGLVVMGYMNGQIAKQLFLAESTVKSHLSSAFGKLGVRSRNEAVRLILDPDRGLGMGILALGGEPLEAASAAK